MSEQKTMVNIMISSKSTVKVINYMWFHFEFNYTYLPNGLNIITMRQYRYYNTGNQPNPNCANQPLILHAWPYLICSICIHMFELVMLLRVDAIRHMIVETAPKCCETEIIIKYPMLLFIYIVVVFIT